MSADPLAYPLTGQPMTLEPGKTYVLRCLRNLSQADIERIMAHGKRLGVMFVVLDASMEIVEATP